MRRIAIITPSAVGYSETFIRAHIERLPNAFVLSAEQLAVLGDPWKAYPRALPWRVLRAGLRRTVWPQVGAWWAERTLERLVRRESIGCVLAEYGTVGARWCDVFAQAGVPFAVHFHGYDAYMRSVVEERREAYARMFGECAAVVAVSRDMVQQLISLGAPRERIHYNPYGVDCSLFARADPAANPPVFLAVGRFLEKKGPHLTLLAFRQVLDAVPEARLVMVGDGPLWDACRQLPGALRMAHAVEMAGVVSHGRVAELMRGARAFVQHSARAPNGDSEGTPVAILEAGASGLPVVATRHAGIKDVVLDGETGLLVDERDVAGMAECMRRLAAEPQTAGRLGEAARARVAAKFSIERSLARLAGILEEAMAKHPPGAASPSEQVGGR